MPKYQNPESKTYKHFTPQKNLTPTNQFFLLVSSSLHLTNHPALIPSARASRQTFLQSHALLHENLATSHLSMWKIDGKSSRIFWCHVLSITNDLLDFSIFAHKGWADSSEIALWDCSFPPKKKLWQKNKFEQMFTAFFQSWKQKRQVFSPQTPASKTLRISGFANLAFGISGIRWAYREAIWLVGFLVDFFEQRHRRLEGSTNKSGKICSTSRLKVATTPIWKKQNSFWWLTGSQGLQPKDSSVDSVFLSKMHHGCSRRLSFSCVIQHVWAKNCLMMYHV